MSTNEIPGQWVDIPEESLGILEVAAPYNIAVLSAILISGLFVGFVIGKYYPSSRRK